MLEKIPLLTFSEARKKTVLIHTYAGLDLDQILLNSLEEDEEDLWMVYNTE